MFSLEILEKDFDMASPEGKTGFFREAARRLLVFEDELERNNYIEAVASAYHVSRESLEKLVAKSAVGAVLSRRPGRAPPRPVHLGGRVCRALFQTAPPTPASPASGGSYTGQSPHPSLPLGRLLPPAAWQSFSRRRNNSLQYKTKPGCGNRLPQPSFFRIRVPRPARDISLCNKRGRHFYVRPS